MPCCFRKTQVKKTEKVSEIKDKYYVFIESKVISLNFVLLILSRKTIDDLHLKEDYSGLDNQRVSENSEGFFRAGLGHASETLPQLLGMTQKIPSPREAVQTVLKCSFMRLWSKQSETHERNL